LGQLKLGLLQLWGALHRAANLAYVESAPPRRKEGEEEHPGVVAEEEEHAP